MSPQTRFWLLLAMIAAVVVFAGAVIFFFIFGGSIHSTRLVGLSLAGPKEVASGEASSWEVVYRNADSVALNSAEIVFEFPPRSQQVLYEAGGKRGLFRVRRVLGDIAAGAEGREEFKGVLFGEIDDVLKGKVVLEYRPEGSSARFAKEIEYTVRITHSQLGVSVEAPNELQEGQEVELAINVVSTSDILFQNLTVGIDYPEAFEFISAQPQPFEGDSIWKIGDINPGEARTISIKGKVKENIYENQTFRARLGIYDSADSSWIVFSDSKKTVAVRTPFLFTAVGLTKNKSNVVFPGQEVDVSIFWKNNLPVSVNNAALEIHLDGKALDLKTVSPKNGGTFDGTTNTIHWLAGRYPQFALLQPGASDRVNFTVVIKQPLPVTTALDKDFAIEFSSRISTGKTPQGFEGVDVSGVATLKLKVATDAGFTQRGYYFDDRVQNYGPLPPKVGEETTYLIVWSITNESNDLRNVEVNASLPTYVRWKGVVVPGNEQVVFDNETGLVTWHPGIIEAGTGIVSPTREVAFQVGFVPSVAHVRDFPEIVSRAVMTAQDAFTGTRLEKTTKIIDTLMKDDPNIKASQGEVKE